MASEEVARGVETAARLVAFAAEELAKAATAAGVSPLADRVRHLENWARDLDASIRLRAAATDERLEHLTREIAGLRASLEAFRT